jgi:CBS domain-containing protein
MPALTQISEIMSRSFFSVQLDDTLKKADDIIKEEKVRFLPVLDGKKFLGLITERKLLEYACRKIYDPESDAGFNSIGDYEHIMEEVSHVIYKEDTIFKAVELFSKYKIDSLPVVDWDYNLEGMLTTHDILLYFRKKLEEERYIKI